MPLGDGRTDPQGQPTVLDYYRLLWRAKWQILALTVVASAVAFGIGRAQPKYYTARATILPPRDSGAQTLSLGSLLGGGGGGGREGGGFFTPPAVSFSPATATTQDVFMAMLRSRTMRMEILDEFARTWGPGVRGLISSIEPTATETRVITLTVEARDPKLAADVANYYLQHLDLLLERYSEQATRRQEKFYRSQLERAAEEVHTAEGAVLKFQSENRFLASLDAGAKKEVEGGGSLRGMVMALELQREVLRMRYTDEHPQMREIEKQIAEVKRQYSKNLFGAAMDLPPESASARGARKEFFVPTEKMTPLQFAYLKLFRNLKIQEAFYTAALQGLQQIKYQDGNYSARVEVLDPAIPPSRPSRPNVFMMVTAAASTGFVSGILLAFGLEYIRRLREQERLMRPPLEAHRRPADSRSIARGTDGDSARTPQPGSVPAARMRGVRTAEPE